MSLEDLREIVSKAQWNQAARDPERKSLRRILELFGHPERTQRFIHITGTNGKGSVTLKTASILAEAGLKTGMFLSPHLYTFRERIQINGEKIGVEPLTKYMTKVLALFESEGLAESMVAYYFVAALLYFRDQKCDYIVLEVGIGARTDSTCVVNPQVSVLTSLGMDHADVIGPTFDDIAYQKAGVIKPRVPVVLGRTAAHPIVLKEAEENNSEVFLVNEESKDFQEENQAIVRKVIEVFKGTDPELDRISETHIKAGIVKRLPCRMEQLKFEFLPERAKGKRIFFDGGHNPQAIKKIGEFINNNKIPKDELVFLYGSAAHRNPLDCLLTLDKLAERIFLVQTESHSSHRAEDIYRLAHEQCQDLIEKFKMQEGGNIKKTFDFVLGDSLCKYIIVTGSFVLMPEARGYFEPQLLLTYREEYVKGPNTKDC